MSTSPYHGKASDRRYAGDAVDITYNVKRCIHAEICVHRLSQVFDAQKRPWIDANGESADRVVAVVGQCPSGALHTIRKDEGAAEPTPSENTITLWQDGPLQVRGNISISAAGVAIEGETRATLCRCGASHYKPFCDNTHKEMAFQTQEVAVITPSAEAPSGGTLLIKAHPNGPLEVSGACEIRDAHGGLIYQGDHTWLCRCGGSSRKPFCDSTHKRNGFTAE
jgi:CDGSH-type Zn-finger protein/uncharacterized Fe-S cluster protein YjdI